MASENIAVLLPKEVVAHIQRIAAAVRDGEVAPLVGAGLSIPVGIPGWTALVERLIRAWQRWDEDPMARQLTPQQYVTLMRKTFETDLALVSYLRNRVESRPAKPSFGELLYAALYGRSRSSLFTPSPSYIHQHLIALFGEHPGILWTTNYDDLLEEAARRAGMNRVRTLDPDRRTEGYGLSIAHVHGFLAPLDRLAGQPEPKTAPVILTEDDFHAVANHVVGWTNREFHRLVDGHRVLVLGMSLNDPNLRRVLSEARPALGSASARHFAVVSSPPRDDRESYANACLSWYWEQRGVELVWLPTHGSILPFLMRLRYECSLAKPGDLWGAGSDLCLALDPWRESRQRAAQSFLSDAVTQLKRDFAISDDSEIVEIGIFLLKDDRTLELTFRGGGGAQTVRGRRLFSVDPDSPTGVVGRVFVSSDLVRIPRGHPLHDYGLGHAPAPSPSYEGIVAVPMIDWKAEGIPIGVVYVTTRTTGGTIFGLQATPKPARPRERTLQDLYVWLDNMAMTLIDVLR